MGIKDLNSVIKKINSSPFKQIPIEKFKKKRFAIDISIFINRFAMSSQQFWFNLMTNFLLNFIKYEITPIIVFDGLHVPEEKMVEREDRKNAKQKSQERECKISHFKEKLMLQCWQGEDTKIVPESLQKEFSTMFRLKDVEINLRDPEEVLLFVTEKLNKAEQAAVGVQKTHKEMTRDLVTSMGFQYIQAYGEAEALCTSMAIHGLVNGVISGDTDNLAYGCPLLITDIKKGVADCVCIDDVLRVLEMSQKQFIDLCICLGCDYNKRMPGIGPAKILPAIKTHGSIRKWREEDSSKPFHILKWKRCREIFRPYSKDYLDEKCHIKTKPFNPAKLNELFQSVDSRYTADYVSNVLNGNYDPQFQGKETGTNILNED